MGGWLSRVLASFRKLDARITMLGLDNSGKTTILYNLKLNQSLMTVPTVGFHVEDINFGKLRMNVWDVCGQSGLRRLWKHYYADADAVIFVIDSADIYRLKALEKGSVFDVMHEVMADETLKDAVLLIFANKQDMDEAKRANELIELLELDRIQQQWFIQESCGTNGEGLAEGLHWLEQTLTQSR
ncbi:hypothetical protein PCE1_003730 [Barthelona sp. PCE]